MKKYMKLEVIQFNLESLSSLSHYLKSMEQSFSIKLQSSTDVKM